MKMHFTQIYKVIFIGFFLSFLCTENTLKAQYGNQNRYNVSAPTYLLGLGMGINDYGIGVSTEFPISNKLSLIGNIGLGGWGWKIGGAISLYPNNILQKSSVSFGYALAMGGEIEQELEVEPSAQKQKVLLKYNQVGTINLIYSYNFKIGKKSKFVISSGYAIPITSNPYDVLSQGVVLTPTSEQILTFVEPGGLIFGLKFMFGI